MSEAKGLKREDLLEAVRKALRNYADHEDDDGFHINGWIDLDELTSWIIIKLDRPDDRGE